MKTARPNLTEEEKVLMMHLIAPFSTLVSCVALKILENRFGIKDLGDQMFTTWAATIELSSEEHIKGMEHLLSSKAKEGIDDSLARAFDAAKDYISDMLARSEKYIDNTCEEWGGL